MRLYAAAGTALSSIILACMVIYLILYCFNCYRSFSNLKQQPYNKFRMANQALRLQVRLSALQPTLAWQLGGWQPLIMVAILAMQVRLRAIGLFFFTLCAIVYFYVELNTCSSYIVAWLGVRT